MFYRWRPPNDVMMMTDFSNAFLGEDLFILGGHPSLNDMPFESLNSPGIMTMALNNVPYVFGNPTFWLTADKPSCYGGHFFHRPDIIKFARMDTSLECPLGSDRELKTLPNLYFYELNGEKYNETNFLTEGVDVVWWKSVFPAALQIAWRMGFRRVFLVGCAFWVTENKTYAWNVELTERQRFVNQRVYNADLERLERLKPHFDAMGFKVYSCTPDSQANGVIEFLPIEEAIRTALAYMPQATPLQCLSHSMERRLNTD